MNSSFFISSNISRLSFYNSIHEFSEFDDFDGNFLEISKSLEAVDFSMQVDYVENTRFFSILNARNKGDYFSKDIAFPTSLVLLKTDLFLFRLLSSCLKFKMILEAKFWFIYKIVFYNFFFIFQINFNKKNKETEVVSYLLV